MKSVREYGKSHSGLDSWKEKPKKEKKMKGLNHVYNNFLNVEIIELNLLVSFISLVLTP